MRQSGPLSGTTGLAAECVKRYFFPWMMVADPLTPHCSALRCSQVRLLGQNLWRQTPHPNHESSQLIETRRLFRLGVSKATRRKKLQVDSDGCPVAMDPSIAPFVLSLHVKVPFLARNGACCANGPAK